MNRASTAPIRRPATAAAARAAKKDWLTEKITEAAKAAARNWPSIAMFTTPARSDRTPASTPNNSGVEYASVRFSWLVRVNGTAEDAAAQTTKPARMLNPAITPAAVR